MTKDRHIIALGGGAFSMEADNGLLDKYILMQSYKKKPRICFMGTASNDGVEYIKMFYDFYSQMNCEPCHLPLSHPPDDIESFLLSCDIVHVGGGNTRMLMEKWIEKGMKKIFSKALTKGIVLTGMSAGAICWFEDGITNPEPGKLDRLECMGYLEGSFCPHYDKNPDLRESFHKLISDGILKSGYGADDGAAVHFVNGEVVRVVTSRPGVTACKVSVFKEKVVETKFEPLYLGKISDGDITGEKVIEEQRIFNVTRTDLINEEIKKVFNS